MDITPPAVAVHPSSILKEYIEQQKTPLPKVPPLADKAGALEPAVAVHPSSILKEYIEQRKTPL
jgi:hypothetical protein